MHVEVYKQMIEKRCLFNFILLQQANMEALELEKDYVMKEMLSFADDILESWQDEICS